uniref:Cytochrome b5 heme-binding domain-containing protein n=1 Tax=Steinernema glaseri TaxID=37863 RepID=A0A1I8A772_9BILA
MLLRNNNPSTVSPLVTVRASPSVRSGTRGPASTSGSCRPRRLLLLSEMARMPNPPLYVKPLVAVGVLTVLVSFLGAHYELESPVWPACSWLWSKLNEIDAVRENVEALKTIVGTDERNRFSKLSHQREKAARNAKGGDKNVDFSGKGLPVFTREQLQLFDGTRPSKPVYLAILGRVYDVERGRKHYGKGGGYHFFAGRDATRAFVSGDFTEEGLVDDVDGLGEQDLLGILDWITFYQRDYSLVGVLQGTYYDADGEMTEKLVEVTQLIEKAKEWRNSQTKESEVFPPCNSEWHKDSGGRVWCTTKSGGVHREWVGVPRKLFSAATKSYRCACVKNFGSPLATHDEKGNRGDLDHPGLEEYAECPPTSMSCKLPLKSS